VVGVCDDGDGEVMLLVVVGDSVGGGDSIGGGDG
jgi:hypothetical protein